MELQLLMQKAHHQSMEPFPLSKSEHHHTLSLSLSLYSKGVVETIIYGIIYACIRVVSGVNV